jgi:diaminopimelate decarboxylase
MSVYGSSASYWRQIDRRMGIAESALWSGEALSGWRTPDTGAMDRGTDPLSRRFLPDTAETVAGDSLSIGGVEVATVAEAIGTPVFIYDEAHLRTRCREARQAFGDGVSFASKAFLCRAMARIAHEEGMMLDVASGGELSVALHAGVPAKRLVLHGSNKSMEELALALDVGIGRIVVDSFDEIDRLYRLLEVVVPGTRPQVLVRINPGITVNTHASIATGCEDSKFGFSLASGAAAGAVELLSSCHSPVDVVGLHTHIGSQIVDLSAFGRTVESLAPLMAAKRLTELCVGGGLGVAYAWDQKRPPSLSEWAAAVRDACCRAGIPDGVRITAEPGRSIAATAAITCYRIGSIKTVPIPSTDGIRTYVSVDGGMSDNLRPALYDSRYEAFLPRAVTAVRPLDVTVVGKHCESGDILVKQGHLPRDVAVGDLLATPVTGAYGYAMASNYNKLLRPPIVFVRDGTYRTVTRRETIEDLLGLDVDEPPAMPAGTVSEAC